MSAQHKYINTMCMVSAKIQSVVCEIMYLSHTTTCSALCNTVLNSCEEDLLNRKILIDVGKNEYR